MQLGRLLTVIVLIAMLMWFRMLYHIFTSSHTPRQPPTACVIDVVVFWSPRVVMRHATLPAAVHVGADGRIAAAFPCTLAEARSYAESHELRLEAHEESVISPGLVDAHAHVAASADGHSRSYEGFASATQAGAAGGVTTIIDLPAH